jgi:hypothetical protein
MGEEKKYSKLNMFVFLIFAVLALVFAVQMFKFIRLGTEKINSDNNFFVCENLNYKIDLINYKANSLVFQVGSYDSSVNFTKLIIVSDSEIEKKEILLEPILKNGDSRILKIDDIKINKSYTVYAEGCEKKGVTVSI